MESEQVNITNEEYDQELEECWKLKKFRDPLFHELVDLHARLCNIRGGSPEFEYYQKIIYTFFELIGKQKTVENLQLLTMDFCQLKKDIINEMNLHEADKDKDKDKESNLNSVERHLLNSDRYNALQKSELKNNNEPERVVPLHMRDYFWTIM
jgi:hypothetical protein